MKIESCARYKRQRCDMDGLSFFFNALLFYLYYLSFVLLVWKISEICCREIGAIWKKTGDVGLLEGACVKSKQQQKQQMEAAQSPIFFVKSKKVPSPSSCFVPFSGVSFLPVSL